jgi:hypothetical protein
MTAFEVLLNGRKICTAGIGEPGVLGAHVSWVQREGNPTADELILHVGGFKHSTREHVRWEEARLLQTGDQVLIKIVAVDSVDEPSLRSQNDPVKDEEARKQYVREMAGQLGWQIIPK